MGGRILIHTAWRGFRRAEFPDESWAVEAGVLHALPGRGGVSLISVGRFADFDLSLEWRLPVGGNSGLLYRVDEEHAAPWQSGPELQLLDDAGHPDGRVPETSCGALYGLVAPRHAPLCPPGLFNIARVSVCGSRVEHWLNGVRVVDCETTSAAFRDRVARSKFRDCSQFARAAEGHVVLQHHGTEAWFRNVRVEDAQQASPG